MNWWKAPALAALLVPLLAAVATAQAQPADPPTEEEQPQEPLPSDDLGPAAQPAPPTPVPAPASEPTPAPAPTSAPAPTPAASIEAKPQPAPAATRALTDLDLSFALSGFAQVDGVLYSAASADELDPTTSEPLNETTVAIPRARLRAGVAKGDLHGYLEIDGNTLRGTAQARLLGVEIAYHIPLPADGDIELPRLRVVAGLFKIPFGRETPEVVQQRWFLETSNTAEALFPGFYDAGVRLEARWRFLEATVAAMNGTPVRDRAFSGRDPSESRDFLGRVGVDVELGGGLRVRAGTSFLTGVGFHPGTPGSKDVLVWVDSNEDGLVQVPELQVIQGRPPTPSATFDHFGLGADLSLHYEVPHLGGGELYGEIVVANNLDRGLQPADPVVLGRDLRELGWYVAVTQEVTRHFVVGARYDSYDPDRDASEPEGLMVVPIDRTFSTLSAFVGWRYGDHGRVILQYDHNENPLGRAASGEPATLAADRLTLRAQMRF